MSAFGKRGVRCDTCGKFSKGKPTGEYLRKDGTCGYIWPDESNPAKDICEECIEKAEPISTPPNQRKENSE